MQSRDDVTPDVTPTRPDLARFRPALAIAVVIAAPLALIAATWEPLEPPPRDARGAVERENDGGRADRAATPGVDESQGTPERRRKAETPEP